MDEQRLANFVANTWNNKIIKSLAEYIKIPNKSPYFDPKWEENGYMEQAIQHISQWCQENAPQNLQLKVIRLPHRTPLLFLEVPGQTEETILLYGHLDKQPEMVGWDPDMGPWKPVLKNERLYGRGAADDGYAVYAALTAINALQEQNLPHPRCVLLIEACEESGSHDLPFYIEGLREEIGNPALVICLDSGAGNYEQLWITTSLRGNIVGELGVEILSEGVHSGNAGGIAADSFRIARQLLSRIEDECTGEIKLAELTCEIPAERLKQIEVCAAVLNSQLIEAYPFLPGVEPMSFDKQVLLINHTWRPALAITGAAGLPNLADAGNVLRPKTAIKFSVRLPPLVDAEYAAQALEKSLLRNPPHQAKISVNIQSQANGWNAPTESEWLQASIQKASETFYGQPAVYMGEGGTIPFMAMLGKQFPAAQFMITGVLGPHSNAHGPNEFLDIPMVKKLTCCIAYVIHQTLSKPQ